MDQLNSNLQEKIKNHPVYTILDNDNKYDLMKNINNDSSILPTNFNGKKIWNTLLSPVSDQGTCGSCWAFATTNALASRFNIQSLGLMNIELSPTKLILCDLGGREYDINDINSYINSINEWNTETNNNFGCTGSTIKDAAKYLYTTGTNTKNCVPYDKKLGTILKYQDIGSFKSGIELPLCSNVTGPIGDMCSNSTIDIETFQESGTPARFYKCLTYYGLYGSKSHGNELQIRLEIYKWGPVVCDIYLYPDFYEFDAKNEIYEWNGKGSKLGGHAMQIVGWGEENNKQFWLIQNSWGKNWGLDGYFKMIRGTDNCSVETNCLGMIPDFFYPRGYKNIPQIPVTITNKESWNKITNQRNNIAYKIDITGGGIDITNGYTRRVMTVMPWINFDRPVDLQDLPDWNKFIAGRDAINSNRVMYMSSTNQKNSEVRYDKQSIQIFITVSVIIIITIIIILILMLVIFYNHKNNST